MVLEKNYGLIYNDIMHRPLSLWPRTNDRFRPYPQALWRVTAEQFEMVQYLRRVLELYLKSQNYPIWSGSMSSTNIPHFLFFTFPAWGKNYHSSLVCPMTYRILGHIRPFCVLASHLVREQENAVVTLMVAPDMLKKTRIEVSRQFLDKSSDSTEAIRRIR